MKMNKRKKERNKERKKEERKKGEKMPLLKEKAKKYGKEKERRNRILKMR